MKKLLFTLYFTFMAIALFAQKENKSSLIDTIEEIAVDSAIEIFHKFSDRFNQSQYNFKYGKFTFNSKWDDIYNLYDLMDEEDLSQFDYNNLSTDNDYVFHLSEVIPFENLKFDDVFLYMSNFHTRTNSELRFYKKFENYTEADNFYSTIVKKIFKTNISYHSNYYYGIGKKLNAGVFINTDKNGKIIVFLTISDMPKLYKNSMLFSYDYYYLSQQFKEIDNDYSFRGIKFGTPLSVIKNITNLKNYRFGSKYTYIPTDEKYTFWKGLKFLESATFFNLTKDFKLAEVSMAYSCPELKDFDNLKEKLVKILGYASVEKDDNGNVFWIGKNITIILSNKLINEDFVYVIIKSNMLKWEIDKDY